MITEKNIDGSPLSREWLDDIYPIARLVAGVLFVAFCGISTVYGVADDLRQPLAHRAAAIQRSAGISAESLAWNIRVVVATGIFIGEVITGERSKRVYALFLIPDVWYSFPWCFVLADALTPDVANIAAYPLALVLAYVAARWGERLLFGGRR